MKPLGICFLFPFVHCDAVKNSTKTPTNRKTHNTTKNNPHYVATIVNDQTINLTGAFSTSPLIPGGKVRKEKKMLKRAKRGSQSYLFKQLKISSQYVRSAPLDG